MKIKIQVLFCFFAFGLIFSVIPKQSLALQDKIDSLRLLLSDRPGNEQTVDKLLTMTQFFIDIQTLDSAIIYAEQALELSTGLKYQAGIAESNYKLHIIKTKRGNFQEAMANIIIFNNISEKLKDEDKLGKGYFSYGVLLGKQGLIDSSIYYIHKSLVINLKQKDTLRLLAIYNSMGNIFLNLSDNDSATYYYLKAIQMAEIKGKQGVLGPLYNNLGKTFTRMMEYDKARQYLEAGLEINKKKNDAKNTIQSLTNLGNNYLEAGDFDSALIRYDQATEALKPLGEVIEMADLYNNYAEVFEHQGKYDLALANYDKALAFYTRQGYAEGIMIALKNKGDIYTQQGKYNLAQKNLDSSLHIATRTGFRGNRQAALYASYENYYQSGNYKKACEYHIMYFMLYDSLLNLDKTNAVREMENKYKNEQLRAQNLNLEKENLKKTIQQNFIIYSAIGLLMLAIFLVLYIHQRRIKDRVISMQKIRQLEEEKKLMTAKLLVEGQEEERKRIATELHDGLGILLSATKMQFTAIMDKSPENQPIIDKVTQLLDQASVDVRRISHNMMPGLLTKLGFYDAVEDLLDNINDIKDMHAICEIEGEQSRLPENKEIMLYRVVQEMVNNALKHARAKNIVLKIKISPDKLFIEFMDDGIGFNPEKDLETGSSSMGLKSIRSRINFLNGEVHLESTPGKGVKYTIHVPA